MSFQSLATAVESGELSNSTVGGMSLEEVSAFSEYVSEYQESIELDKFDKGF
jgi:hypothetical protein